MFLMTRVPGQTRVEYRPALWEAQLQVIFMVCTFLQRSQITFLTCGSFNCWRTEENMHFWNLFNNIETIKGEFRKWNPNGSFIAWLEHELFCLYDKYKLWRRLCFGVLTACRLQSCTAWPCPACFMQNVTWICSISSCGVRCTRKHKQSCSWGRNPRTNCLNPWNDSYEQKLQAA